MIFRGESANSAQNLHQKFKGFLLVSFYSLCHSVNANGEGGIRTPEARRALPILSRLPSSSRPLLRYAKGGGDGVPTRTVCFKDRSAEHYTTPPEKIGCKRVARQSTRIQSIFLLINNYTTETS